MAEQEIIVKQIRNDDGTLNMRIMGELVRCGECIFWDRCHISCEGLAKCLTGESGIRYRNRSDFCSRGRTEGQ